MLKINSNISFNHNKQGAMWEWHWDQGVRLLIHRLVPVITHSPYRSCTLSPGCSWSNPNSQTQPATEAQQETKSFRQSDRKRDRWSISCGMWRGRALASSTLALHLKSRFSYSRGINITHLTILLGYNFSFQVLLVVIKIVVMSTCHAQLANCVYHMFT